MPRRPLLALLPFLLAPLVACAEIADPAPLPAGTTKRVSFALLEDYDKGQSLEEVARDFALMRALGVTTWRGSLGWDDYEPEPGVYDFAWLHQFAELAARAGIGLRPYVGYTPEWAALGRTADGQAWNDPPADVATWARFVDTLSRALSRHPNLLSLEIYNEQNVPLWWDGSVREFNEVLAAAAPVARTALADLTLFPGGLVWPDAEWFEATCATHGNRDAVDVIAVHAYPETWTPDSVRVESYLGADFAGGFLPSVRAACGPKPVWINETGFATTPGRTERQQADWWVRAMATFLAAPGVEHIGIYEIKDLRLDSPVIGDAPNYHLGITRVDRTPKLAFYTLQRLVQLLDADSLTVLDASLGVRVTGGRAEGLRRHLFLRPDGAQVAFVWVDAGTPTVSLRLPAPGSQAIAFALDGTPTPWADFDGRTIRDVRVRPGEARFFVVLP